MSDHFISEDFIKAAKIDRGLNDRHFVPVEEIIPGIDTKGMASIVDLENSKPPEDNYATFGNAFSTGYADHLNLGDRFVDYRREAVSAVFDAQVVVELGPGKTSLREASFLDKSQGYVAVEPFHFQPLLKGMKEYPRRADEDRVLPCSLSNDDMLTFLRRLPDASVSILISGVDYNVVTTKYGKEVVEEMKRVLHQNGGIISNRTFLDSEQMLDAGDGALKCYQLDGRANSLYTKKEVTQFGLSSEEVILAMKKAGIEKGDFASEAGYVREFRIWKSLQLTKVMNSENKKDALVRHMLEATDILLGAEMELNFGYVRMLKALLPYCEDAASKTGDDSLLKRLQEKLDNAQRVLDKWREEFRLSYQSKKEKTGEEKEEAEEKEREREKLIREKFARLKESGVDIKRHERFYRGTQSEDKIKDIDEEYEEFIESRDIFREIMNFY